MNSEVATGLRRTATTAADLRIGAKQLEGSRKTLLGVYLRGLDVYHEGGVAVERWGIMLESQREGVHNRTKTL